MRKKRDEKNMDFIDLNLINDGLREEAKKIGWNEAKACKIVSLRENRDINFTNSKELITIESQNPELLRNCIKQRKPIMCNPLYSKDFYKDEGLIREAIERETVFELPISEFLKTSFVYRAKLINNTRNFIKKCLKLGAGFVFTSRATNEYELKSPQEVVAIATTLFDLTEEQAKYAISTRARKVLDAIS
jgi:RNase P/RNase MRP subunit p30